MDEKVRLSIETDLLPDGSFGRELLVVTDRSVRVHVLDGPTPRPRLDLPFHELAEPRAEQFVGGGALEVSHNGVRLEVVRCSSARLPRIAVAARMLEKWLRGEDAELPPEEPNLCPRCGLPLARDTRVCPTCASKGRTLWRLVRCLGPSWPMAAGIMALSVLGSGLSLVPPYLQKPLMDRVLLPREGLATSTDERLRLLGLLVLAVVGVSLAAALVTGVKGYLGSWLGNRLTHSIRCQLYRHLQYLSLSFYDKREIGMVISRVNNDSGELHHLLVWAGQELIRNLLMVLGIGTMLFVLNWRLALLVSAPAPIVAVLSVFFWKRIRHYLHRVFHRLGRLNALLSESLAGLRVVKAFAQEQRAIEGFSSRSSSVASASLQATRAWIELSTVIGTLIMLGMVLVWFFGGRSVILGEMTAGTLLAFLAYMMLFLGPMQSLTQMVDWASRSLTAAERVFEVLDVQPEVRAPDDPVPMPSIEGRVAFRHVTFGYEPHHPVLKDLDFEVARGEMIGLVGHSGAGKTTTINLLCRFYDPDEGEILVDGVPLRRIPLDDLRGQLGVVPQDTFLFGGTIAENIAYAKPGASREEIVRAAKVANAHDFILRKPDGYETPLGEAGAGLSAGEKQRLAIARALLHNPRILILDEATSQLDVETEKQVQEAIGRLVAGRTTFAIAHRLSTLRHADRLIVLKSGEVAQIGTHDELMERDGEFRRLVRTYQEIAKVRLIER